MPETKTITTIQLFPNPTTGDLFLKVDHSIGGEFQLDIYDSMGRTQLARRVNLVEGSNTFEVDVASLNNGIYMLVLSNKDNEVKMVRFAKR